MLPSPSSPCTCLRAQSISPPCSRTRIMHESPSMQQVEGLGQQEQWHTRNARSALRNEAVDHCARRRIRKADHLDLTKYQGAVRAWEPHEHVATLGLAHDVHPLAIGGRPLASRAYWILVPRGLIADANLKALKVCLTAICPAIHTQRHDQALLLQIHPPPRGVFPPGLRARSQKPIGRFRRLCRI